MSKEYFDKQKKSNEWFQESSEIFDEEMALNLAKWSRSEISPICNCIGGIIAQEIVKYTGKYTPIDQWLWFDFYNSIKTYWGIFRMVNLVKKNIEVRIFPSKMDRNDNGEKIASINKIESNIGIRRFIYNEELEFINNFKKC